MTLSIWAKTPDTSRYQFLFGNNSTGNDGIWLNQYDSVGGVDDVTVFYLAAGYVYFSNPNNNILDNTWFNFIAVFDASGSSNTDKVKTDSRHFELHKLFIHFNFTVKTSKAGLNHQSENFYYFIE